MRGLKMAFSQSPLRKQPGGGADPIFGLWIKSVLPLVLFISLTVQSEGNEILGVDDFDLFASYQVLWKTESEKHNTVRQGIIRSGCCTENCMKLQINASDKNASKQTRCRYL